MTHLSRVEHHSWRYKAQDSGSVNAFLVWTIPRQIGHALYWSISCKEKMHSWRQGLCSESFIKKEPWTDPCGSVAPLIASKRRKLYRWSQLHLSLYTRAWYGPKTKNQTQLVSNWIILVLPNLNYTLALERTSHKWKTNYLTTQKMANIYNFCQPISLRFSGNTHIAVAQDNTFSTMAFSQYQRGESQNTSGSRQDRVRLLNSTYYSVDRECCYC